MKVGYYAGWSIYRQEKSLNEIVEGGYTHIIYAFATISDNGKLQFHDSYAAIDKGVLKQAKSLPVKLGLSIGGWHHKHQFKGIKNYRSFAQAVKEFLLEHSFEFVDVDWEFETKEEAIQYSEKRLQLIMELRECLGDSFPLFMAIQASTDILRASCISRVLPHVDYLILMAYDFCGPWSDVARPYCNLTKTDTSLISVDWIVQTLSSELSLPTNRLILGVSGYGIVFSECSSLGMPFKTAQIASLKDLASFECSDSNCITSETVESFEAKKEFVKGKGLAGLCVWDIEAFSYLNSTK